MEWTYQGNYLSVSKTSTTLEGSFTAGSSLESEYWSFQGDQLKMNRKFVYGDASSSGTSTDTKAAASSSGKKSSLEEAESYLTKHQVQTRIELAVNEVLKLMPENPMAALAEALQRVSINSSSEDSKPQAPQVDVAALEAEIKSQGDKIRSMKDAVKANPSAFAKEEIDAEVAKLKELKGKMPANSSDKEKGDKKEKGKKEKDDKASKHLIPVEPVMGTRDFYPEDMRARNWLFGHFKEVARRFAFQEYDAPVLEHEELYKRKAGEEITQQMYNFVDKSGYAVTLRPEMTPTLARMILGRTTESGETKMILPVKWFSLPQCWRFETTQRGRKREHYQWNMDIVGVKSITAEVELLAAITTFFTRVGITAKDVGIKVNSRKVMASILKSQGISDQQFAPVCVVVDKLDKIGPEEVTKELVQLGVSEKTAGTIIKTMSARSVEELSTIAEGADQEGLEELKELFAQAEAYGYGDFMQFDASVVRGLAYYTGIVFECFDRSGELRAICGGGRYDRLLSLYGSKQEVPCVGFGFGDCVIMELLQMKKLLPDFPQLTDFVVAPFSKDMLPNALKVAAKLREAGATVDMQVELKKKVGQTFDYANRVGAQYVALVAPDEWNKNMVRVKDLRMEDKDANQKDVFKNLHMLSLAHMPPQIPLDKLHEWRTIFGST